MSSVPISMRVTPSAAERLREAAARMGMGHSEYARLVLEAALVGSNQGSAPTAHIEAHVEAPALWALLRALLFSAGVHEWILRRAKREELIEDGWNGAELAIDALADRARMTERAEADTQPRGSVGSPRVPLAARLDEAAAAVLRQCAERERMAPSTYAARVLEGATAPSDSGTSGALPSVVREILRTAFFVSRSMEQLGGRELDAHGLWTEAEARVTELLGWQPDRSMVENARRAATDA